MLDFDGINSVWFSCILMNSQLEAFKEVVAGYIKCLNYIFKCHQHFLWDIKISYFLLSFCSPIFKSLICFSWRKRVISPYGTEDRDKGCFQQIFFDLMPHYIHVSHHRIFDDFFLFFLCVSWVKVSRERPSFGWSSSIEGRILVWSRILMLSTLLPNSTKAD